jgi:predicted MFS family arabinose efflux permease
VGLGGALPLLHLQLGIVYASAFLVGSSLFIAPSAMAVLARQVFSPADRASGLMVFSIVFAIGQTIGSWGFGQIADAYSLNAVLAVSSIGLILASIIASQTSTDR